MSDNPWENLESTLQVAIQDWADRVRGIKGVTAIQGSIALCLHTFVDTDEDDGEEGSTLSKVWDAEFEFYHRESLNKDAFCPEFSTRSHGPYEGQTHTITVDFRKS